MTTLKLGTRGSPLAMWQARWIAAELEKSTGAQVTIVEVKSTAEEFPEKALAQMGVGVFTAQLDQALIDGEIDLAVHSLKDVPSTLLPELALAAVPERESPWDCFLSANGSGLRDLPHGARVGTSSPRRQAQLLALRPDLEMVPLRGNVDTRLRKVREQGLAGTVLAHAGLKRLGKDDLITEVLGEDVIVPAISQGALGVVTRGADEAVKSCVAQLEHAPSRIRVEAERAYLRRLRGGCQVPAGALATLGAGGAPLRLVAVLATPDGRRCLRTERRGDTQDATKLGEDAAEQLLAELGPEDGKFLVEGRGGTPE